MEEWRPIPRFPKYEASTLGRIRSWISGVAKIMKPSVHKVTGYLYLNLRHEGKTITVYVHRAVLETFVGPCPPGMQARHFPDATRTNDALSNLSWATPTVNSFDKGVHGTQSHGDDHRWSKLNEKLVEKILESADPPDVLAAKHHVTRAAIMHVLSGKNWRRVFVRVRGAA